MTDSDKEARAERRLVGLQLALMDLSPPLEFLGLGTYVIEPCDVGLQVWDIIRRRADERITQIEREKESEGGDAPRS